MSHSPDVAVHMSKYPYIANRKMPVSNAQDFMQAYKIHHLPVLDEGQVVGIISDRDLTRAMAFGRPEEIRVEEIMTKDTYLVKPSTPLAEVAKTMAERRIGSAVIVDNKNHIVGIFTSTDAMRVLSQVLQEGPDPLLGLKSVELFTEFEPKLSP